MGYCQTQVGCGMTKRGGGLARRSRKQSIKEGCHTRAKTEWSRRFHPPGFAHDYSRTGALSRPPAKGKHVRTREGVVPEFHVVSLADLVPLNSLRTSVEQVHQSPATGTLRLDVAAVVHCKNRSVFVADRARAGPPTYCHRHLRTPCGSIRLRRAREAESPLFNGVPNRVRNDVAKGITNGAFKAIAGKPELRRNAAVSVFGRLVCEVECPEPGDPFSPTHLLFHNPPSSGCHTGRR